MIRRKETLEVNARFRAGEKVGVRERQVQVTKEESRDHQTLELWMSSGRTWILATSTDDQPWDSGPLMTVFCLVIAANTLEANRE